MPSNPFRDEIEKRLALDPFRLKKAPMGAATHFKHGDLGVKLQRNPSMLGHQTAKATHTTGRRDNPLWETKKTVRQVRMMGSERTGKAKVMQDNTTTVPGRLTNLGENVVAGASVAAVGAGTLVGTNKYVKHKTGQNRKKQVKKSMPDSADLHSLRGDRMKPARRTGKLRRLPNTVSE